MPVVTALNQLKVGKTMIHLPSIPKTFSELLGFAIRRHFVVLRKIIWLIVFLVVVKDTYIYLGGMPMNPYWLSLIGIVMAFLILYLISAMLYATHCVLYNENIDWRSALSDMTSRIGRVVFAFIFFVVIPIIFYFIGYWISHWLLEGSADPSKYFGLIIVLLVSIPMMLVYLYYFFVIPLIVTENFAVREAFKRSPALIGHEWRNLLRVFGVYACVLAIWLLVSPDTLHGHLLKMYKLSALFDFIVFSVTIPILMNLIILMRNDLKLRKAIREGS